VDPARGTQIRLEMVPTRLKHFLVHQAADAEARWLESVLNREGRPFGTGVSTGENNQLTLH
jgi:hypothetical protein